MGQHYVIQYGYASANAKYMVQPGTNGKKPRYTTNLEEAILLDDDQLLDLVKQNKITGAMTIYKAKVKIELERETPEDNSRKAKVKPKAVAVTGKKSK